MFPSRLALQEYRPGGIRDSACWPELVTNPDRQLPLYPRAHMFGEPGRNRPIAASNFKGARAWSYHVERINVSAMAWDPIIATSARVALPRLSNDDQERIWTCRGDRKLLIDKRQIGGATS